MSDTFAFRCKSNPQGPLLILSTFWEAKEMRGHPDYERVDESGDVVVDEEDRAAPSIPIR